MLAGWCAFLAFAKIARDSQCTSTLVFPVGNRREQVAQAPENTIWPMFQSVRALVLSVLGVLVEM